MDSDVVHSPEETAEKSQPPRAPQPAVLLMTAIVICLAILALFANIQRSRRDAVEAVTVKLMASPPPQQR